MGLKKTDDHWAFLEEFEAPMWADLTLEAKTNNQDVDDKWFHISHPFHQFSSHQLKSAFSGSSEGSENLDFDLHGPSSPKLPSSVSRSRGKHYRSRNWGKENGGFSLNKQHPVKSLSGKTSWVDSGSSQEIKPKPSCGNLKGTCSSKTSLGCDSSSTRTSIPNYTIPISSFGDSKGRLSSVAIKASESNSTTSTITFEGTHQQPQKSLEVSSGPFGHTSGLLSVMRITLRKSCATRQASRVEINKCQQSEGCKSSAGKSSVGSSSNPGYDVKDRTATEIRNRDRTPDSRNVMRTSQTAVNRGRASTTSKASNILVDYRTNNSRKEGKRIVAKSTTKDAVKSKVVCQTINRKGLVPLRVNEQDPLTAATKAKSKVGVGASNRLAGGGKENASGELAVSQKSSGRDIAARDIVRGQTGKKQSISRKGDKTGFTGPKGKISGRSEGKTSMNVHQKVFLP